MRLPPPRADMPNRLPILAAFIAGGIALSGCSTIESRVTGRTATEQYLVTEAIHRAMKKVNWDRLAGQRVAVEIVGVDVDEYDFIREEMDRQLTLHQARMVEDATEADVFVTALVQSVGTDIWVSNLGVPLFLAANPEIPNSVSGISLYNSNLQEGYCRIRFIGRDPRTHRPLWRVDPVTGDAYFKTTTILGLIGPMNSSDIFPERKYIRPKGYIPIPREADD